MRLAFPVSADTLLRRAVTAAPHSSSSPLKVLGVDDWAWRHGLPAGSDGDTGRLADRTAKLDCIAPYAWLDNILQRMTNGHPIGCLDELLPWNWQSS